MSFRDSDPPMFPMKHPCPCGSGRKFKHCCVDEVYVDTAVVLRVEHRNPGFLAALLAGLNTDPLLQKAKP